MRGPLRCFRLGCAHATAVALAFAFLLACPAAGARADVLSATAQDVYTYGYYTDDQLHTYGTAVSFTVANGDAYSALASRVTALTNTTVTSGAPYDRVSAPVMQPKVARPPFLGSQAELLAGANSSGNTQTITMAWRNRTDVETDGDGYPFLGFPDDGVQTPPLALDSFGMASDIVDLKGVTGSYVLQMSYDPGALISDSHGWTEDELAAKGKIYLGWFEDQAHIGGGNLPNQREWELATLGDTGTGANVIANYQGSFSSFTSRYTDFTPDSYLGSYGVDTATHTVWAVLDHNSEFGAVPEPCTAALLIVGALGLLKRRRTA